MGVDIVNYAESYDFLLFLFIILSAKGMKVGSNCR